MDLLRSDGLSFSGPRTHLGRRVLISPEPLWPFSKGSRSPANVSKRFRIAMPLGGVLESVGNCWSVQPLNLYPIILYNSPTRMSCQSVVWASNQDRQRTNATGRTTTSWGKVQRKENQQELLVRQSHHPFFHRRLMFGRLADGSLQVHLFLLQMCDFSSSKDAIRWMPSQVGWRLSLLVTRSY